MSGDTDKALVYAVLALKQSDATQRLADAARYFIRHPSPEAYAELATLVDG